MTLPHECRYGTKRRYLTKADARRGAERIREEVTARGDRFDTLHPYECPSGGHWHLSSSRQSQKGCTRCQTLQPSWFNAKTQEWVIYAHGDCPTAAVMPRD